MSRRNFDRNGFSQTTARNGTLTPIFHLAPDKGIAWVRKNLTEMNTLEIIKLCYWIGQKYAMQEMKTLLVVILKKFKILPVIDPKSIVFQTGITLRTQNEIKVKFVKRKVSS